MEPQYRLFADESGDAQEKNVTHPDTRYLGLTGVVIPLAEHNGAMARDLERLKEDHIPAHPEQPVILHREDIMRKTGPFGVLADPERAAAWERDVRRFLRRWVRWPITVVIDKLLTQQQYGTDAEDHYTRAMRYMLQRYRGVLFYGLRGAMGDVMCEARGKNENQQLMGAYRRIYAEGPQHLTGEQLQEVLTSKELKIADKKKNIAGLQLADLIANPAMQLVLQEHRGHEPKRDTTTQRVIEIIRPRYRPVNRVMFPKE